MSIHDAQRSGRAITVTNDQHYARVDNNIRGNRQIKQSEITSKLAISKECVQAITADLKYRKICVHWVPRQLTEDMRKQRDDIANAILSRFRREGDQFLQNIVTGDETWVHHYDP